MLVVLPPAIAHITLDAQQAPAHSYFKRCSGCRTVCAASPTVRLRIRMPDGVTAVKPQPKPGWKLDTTRVEVVPAIDDGHGGKITEKISEVTWSDGHLPDQQFDEFAILMRLPDRAGETLYFPIVQECEKGVSRWIEIPAAGKPAGRETGARAAAHAWQVIRWCAVVVAVLGLRAAGGPRARPREPHRQRAGRWCGAGRQPAEIVFRFDEPVVPIAVRLLDDTGASVALGGSPVALGDTLRVALPAALRKGSYWLSYRVTSSDAHPVAGAMTFSLGSPSSGPAPQALRTLSDVDAIPRVASRAVQDLAVMLCGGGALFALLLAPWPRQRRVLVVAAAIALLAAVIGVCAQGAALLGTRVGFFGHATWAAGFASTRGMSACLVCAGVLVIAAGALVTARTMTNALFVGGIALLVASACVTGHPATLQPRALALPAIVFTCSPRHSGPVLSWRCSCSCAKGGANARRSCCSDFRAMAS